MKNATLVPLERWRRLLHRTATLQALAWQVSVSYTVPHTKPFFHHHKGVVMKSAFRSAWLSVGFVVLAVSVSLWIGCNDPQNPSETPSSHQSSGVVTLDKSNPQVSVAIAVQERHTGELLANPDIVGTGVGADADGKPVVLILTRHDGVRNLPSSIEGVSTRIDVVGDIRPMAGYTKKYRPVPCGVSIGNDLECAAGTIGCVVQDNAGNRYALSNNHVFARENAASLGERLDQPGRYDGKPLCARTEGVAALYSFKTISTSQSNVIDAAIASYTTAYTVSMVDNLYTPSSTTALPSVGLAVKKVGRTSGLTTGTITGINVTISVQYDFGVATFTNQIYVAGNFIRSGDSGSLMVTQSGNNPVGLNFAGSGGASFANPIGPVLDYFGVTVASN